MACPVLRRRASERAGLRRRTGAARACDEGVAGRWSGQGRSGCAADRRAGAGFRDGGEQRGRDDPAGRRTGEALPRAGRAVPHRRGPGAFHGCAGCCGAGRRSGEPVRAQALWADGDRRAVCEAGCERAAVAVRRRTAGRPAAGNLADGAVRRAGCGVPDRARAWGCRCGAASGLAGTAVRCFGRRRAGLEAEQSFSRGHGAGGMPACRRAGAGCGGPAARPAGTGALDRIGVQQRGGRAVARAACDGPVGGGCLRQHPDRAGAVYYGGRSGSGRQRFWSKRFSAGRRRGLR